MMIRFGKILVTLRMFLISSSVDLRRFSDCNAAASILFSRTDGHKDFETIPEFPNLFHISSAICGAKGESIDTLAEKISCKVQDMFFLFFALDLFRYHCMSESNSYST